MLLSNTPIYPDKEIAMNNRSKFTLTENDLPKRWYNINADMPVAPQPVLHPGTLEPVTPDFLSVLFPMELIMQEMSPDQYIDIPEEIREIYQLFRPTPLLRARRLEKALDTPAHIYYKYEGASPAGSHKPNTAIAQAFYNKAAGTEALTTETGAGQWGTALAMAGSLFDLAVEVFMVKISYNQKPYRRILMETYGADVFASPSDRTQFGQALLKEDPANNGSLGIAISEAVEVAASSEGKKKYSLGSVLNHVLLHQTVIGEESLMQMDLAGEYPDVVIGCIGGGSNFSGIAFPFLRNNFKEGKKTRLLAVEPQAAPSLTKGTYAFDYGDSAKMAPVVKMHTLGHSFLPAPIHAGGLRYHGMSPTISALYENGDIEAIAVPQLGTFEAALQFARTEGILPAPESAHAIRGAIDEALDAKKKGDERVILFNLSGHGHFDLAAYEAYLAGQLQDFEYPAENVTEALKAIPQVPAT
jgi:tryptophan synthase beta chain